EELGFQGMVVADYTAVVMLMRYHHVAANKGEAARQALLAGLDMELPSIDCYGEDLKAEVEAGCVSQAAIDTAVRRVLRLKFRLGLFEHPYIDEECASIAFQSPEQRALARKAAAESVILLTNNGILPLSPTTKRVAVIGPGADDERLLQGDYHYPSHLEMIYAASRTLDVGELAVPQANGKYAPGPYFTPHITPLAGLRAALGPEVEIRYAKGCDVLGDDCSGFEEALQAVNGADVAIVVVAGKSGLLRPVTVGESNDATDLNLTGVQQGLIDTLAQSGTPLVIAVLSGRVHTLTSLVEKAAALLQVFPSGEEGGNGLADILTGKINPAGRLPVSMPRSVGQIPNYVGTRAGGDRAMFFGDYIDSPTTPLFSFGHGLSYTTFAYENIVVQAKSSTDPIEVSVTVRNTGQCAGDEVVQLYCRDEVASVARPQRQLIGFTRLSLNAGQARNITFVIHPSRLAFYDPEMRFVTEPGAFAFSVGASSSDIRTEQTATLEGEVAQYRQCAIIATKVVID
ncbi:MAG TPA: glycoside hydrolase family 3 C-terminal domain-containing protein, partial [Ktedonobacteraceae bacterium]|nr:glycoside hydrolase family 3 C-terminal domain-containing protein [Ktedonobacteraceae bacterium]